MARAVVVRLAEGARKARPLTKNLLESMGLRPDGDVNEFEARRILDQKFKEVFRAVNRSFKALLSKSSVRFGAGVRWDKEGGQVGAKYTYDLYNSLARSIRYRNEKKKGFGASFTISSNSPHYGYVDENVNPTRIPLSELLLFAIKRIPGWGHIPRTLAGTGFVDLEELQNYRVPMTSQSPRHRRRSEARRGTAPDVSARWALGKMYGAVRKSSYRGLQLTKHILEYSSRALAREAGQGAILTDQEMIAVFSPPKS